MIVYAYAAVYKLISFTFLSGNTMLGHLVSLILDPLPYFSTCVSHLVFLL